jgi:serine/threonine-protein kinase
MVMQDLESAAGVRAGDVLAGKYRVERVLGAGGMGVVVAAHHLGLNEKVALKFLLPSLLGNAEVVERFAREARAAVRIKSEHVARVSDVGTLENGAPYMVMEFLEGEDLSSWLQRRGPLPVDLAVDFLLQACVAVADAHALGIVHRDLKPANLFCARRSDGQFVIKVLDFGISKITQLWDTGGGHAMTQTTSVMGSPFYMSPEQMQSSRDVDTLTDIWALGVTLYELLTGARPFAGESYAQLAIRVATAPFAPVRTLRRDVPEALEPVLLRCLEKDKRLRFPNVGELAIALGPFASVHSQPSLERVVGIMRASGLASPGLYPQTAVAPPWPPSPPSPPQPPANVGAALTPPSGGRPSIGTTPPTANTANTASPASAAPSAWRLGAVVGTAVLLGAASIVAGFVVKRGGGGGGPTVAVGTVPPGAGAESSPRPGANLVSTSSANGASAPTSTSVETSVETPGPSHRALGNYLWNTPGGPPLPAPGQREGGPERFLGQVRSRGDDQLWVVAYDSAKLGELWHVGPFGSYGDGYLSTFLAVTGKQVVVTDYLTNIHVYDLDSGRELRTAKLSERAKGMCASPEGDGRVWIVSSDGRKVFFDAGTGAINAAGRPPWCPDLWASHYDCRGWLKRGAPRPLCQPPGAAPGVPGFDADNVLEQGDVGVALGKKSPGTEVPMAVGFDPHTKHVRWSRFLAPGDQARIKEASVISGMDELAGGRFVAPYESSATGWHFVGIDARNGDTDWDVALPPINGVDHAEGFTLTASRLYVMRVSAVVVYDANTGALVGSIADW